MVIETRLRSILERTLNIITKRIRAQHIGAKQVASGRTLASIRYEMQSRTNGVHGIIWGRAPFGTLETGRRGGRVPKGFNAIIQQWVIDKGIHYDPIPYKRMPSENWQPKYTPEQRGLMSIAGAIAYKIKTEGTSLFRAGGRSDIYSNAIQDGLDKLDRDIQNLLQELAPQVVTDNKHIKLN